MAVDRYLVTRLAGAPPRRAGRAWPEGAPVEVDDLTPAQLRAIAADPGYLIVAAAAAPEPAPMPQETPDGLRPEAPAPETEAARPLKTRRSKG